MRVSCPPATLATILLVAAASPGPSPAQADPKPSDLTGTYVVVGGEREGTQEPPERIQGTTVRFTAETVVVVSPDQKEIYSATYKLQPADKAGVSRIRMTSRVPADKGEVAQGLIARDKDGTVRLIYALPGGGEPTEFRTKAQQLMFVMKPSAERPEKEPAGGRNLEP